MNLDSKLNLLIAVLVEGELILIMIFAIIGMYRGYGFKENTLSILKGILERTFLTFSLVNDLPVAIIFFGAIKLGTRLDHSNNKVTNDQFLVGNILSVFFAIIYFKVWVLLT
ncbi:MAG: hypothetical protein PVH88_12860 [Ignavibacteria bacterium]|jgi:hypothetical protein